MTRSSLLILAAACFAAAMGALGYFFTNPPKSMSPMTVDELLEKSPGSVVVMGSEFRKRRLRFYEAAVFPVATGKPPADRTATIQVGGQTYEFDEPLPTHSQHHVILAEDLETGERGWLVIRRP